MSHRRVEIVESQADKRRTNESLASFEAWIIIDENSRVVGRFIGFDFHIIEGAQSERTLSLNTSFGPLGSIG